MNTNSITGAYYSNKRESNITTFSNLNKDVSIYFYKMLDFGDQKNLRATSKKWLEISNLAQTSLVPKTLEDNAQSTFPNIEALALKGPNEKNNQLEILLSFKHLNRLTLIHSNITETSLSRLNHLTEINLAYPLKLRLGSKFGVNFNNLKLMRIHGFKKLKIESLATLPNLESLSLGLYNCDFVFPIVDGFSNLSHLALKNFDARDAPLSNLSNISNLPKITHLYIKSFSRWGTTSQNYEALPSLLENKKLDMCFVWIGIRNLPDLEIEGYSTHRITFEDKLIKFGFFKHSNSPNIKKLSWYIEDICENEELYSVIDKSYIKTTEIASKVLKKCVLRYQEILEIFNSEPSLFRKVLPIYPSAISLMSKTLLRSHGLQFLKKYPATLGHLPSIIHSEVLLATANIGKYLPYLSLATLENPHVWRKMLRENPDALGQLPINFRDSESIVSWASSYNPLSLRFASERIRNDFEFCTPFVLNNITVLRYVNPSLYSAFRIFFQRQPSSNSAAFFREALHYLGCMEVDLKKT